MCEYQTREQIDLYNTGSSVYRRKTEQACLLEDQSNHAFFRAGCKSRSILSVVIYIYVLTPVPRSFYHLDIHYATAKSSRSRQRSQEGCLQGQSPTRWGQKRRKKRKESYAIYIYKVLKQVHPDTGVSSKAMSIMNSFVNDIFERIAAEASRLAHYNKRSTITSREIQTAVVCFSR